MFLYEAPLQEDVNVVLFSHVQGKDGPLGPTGPPAVKGNKVKFLFSWDNLKMLWYLWLF